MAQEKPPLRPLMSMLTAAAYLGCSKRHFTRILENNSIPVHKIGHTHFILGTDLVRIEYRPKPVDRKWNRSKLGPHFPKTDISKRS